MGPKKKIINVFTNFISMIFNLNVREFVIAYFRAQLKYVINVT